MKTGNRLSLMHMPELREEILMGRNTRMATKMRMVRNYDRLIVKAVLNQNFAEAAILTSKLGAIMRCWEVKQKAENLAMLKSSAPAAPKFA